MENETVMHYLLMCPEHERHRRPIFSKFGTDAKSIRFLLSEPKALKLLLRYINATARFKTAFGDLVAPLGAPRATKKKT